MKPYYLFFLLILISPNCADSDNPKFDRLNLEEITVEQLQENYINGVYTARDVVEAYLERIEDFDKSGPKVNSIIALNPDALAIADSLDEYMRMGNLMNPLHGVPVLLKDNIDTGDKMPNTAGSRVMMNSQPIHDSFIVQQLRKSGAIILGKTNLSEWANYHSNISSSGWSGLGGQTNNPYDITRNPCGSSSGSGASIAANFAVLSVGTETNGSIVCPASANGIVGIKPTVGLLSRSGIIPISKTQDTPGPMARTVTDAAIMLGAMTGIDNEDEKTKLSDGYLVKDYTVFLETGTLKGKRLGFYTPSRSRNTKVDSLLTATLSLLKELGADIIEINQIGDRSVSTNSSLVMNYEFKDGVNNYLVSMGESAPVKNLGEIIEKTLADPIEMQFDHKILINAQEKGDLSSPEYLKALDAMLDGARANGIDKVMNENNLHALIGISGGPAWKTDSINGDHFSTSSSSPAAIAGYPNISVPMGFIDGMPVGLSFFGKAWSEPELIALAYSFEQATKVRKPPILKK